MLRTLGFVLPFVLGVSSLIVANLSRQRAQRPWLPVYRAQQDCLRYAPTPGTIVYAEGVDAAPLAGKPGYSLTSVAAEALASGETWGPQVALQFQPPQWTALCDAFRGAGRPAPPAGAIVFLHERWTPSRQPKLVMVDLVQDGRASVLRVDVDDPAPWPQFTLGPLPITEFRIGRSSPSDRFELMAGEVDTSDLTHFTIPYRFNGRAGKIEGHVQNDQHVHLDVDRGTIKFATWSPGDGNSTPMPIVTIIKTPSRIPPADPRLMTEAATAGGCLGLAISRDGGTLAIATFNGVYLCGAKDGKVRRVLQVSGWLDHGTPVTIAFSPDGTTLASGEMEGTVRLWRVADGKPLHKCSFALSPIEHLDFSSDGGGVAAVGAGGDAAVFDANTGRELESLPRNGGYRCIGFAADGKNILTTDEQPNGLSALWTYSGDTGHSRWSFVGIGRGFSGDGKAVLVSAPGELQLLDLDSQKVLWRRPSPGGHPDYDDARFTPDGRYILAKLTMGGVRLWEYPSMTEQEIDCSLAARVAFSAATRTLATIDDSMHLAFWSLPPNQPTSRLGEP